MAWLEALQTWALDMSQSPWALLILFVMVTVDGIFPPCPSEIVLTAIATFAAAGTIAGGQWWLIVVVIVAALGAFTGDIIAYSLGRMLPHRFSSSRQEMIRRARATLKRHPAPILISARFIPVWRVIVNLGAGNAGLALPVYLPIVAVTSMLWSIYNCTVGILMGSLLSKHPFMGLVIGVSLGLLFGFAIERFSRAQARRRGLQTGAEDEETVPANPAASGGSASRQTVN